MKAVAIVLALSEKSKDVATVAVKSLQHEGFGGPIVVINQDSFKDLPALLSSHPAQRTIRFARPAVVVANLAKFPGVKEAIEGADAIVVINEDVMTVKDPSAELVAMKPGILYVPGAAVNFDYFRTQIPVPPGLMEKPALLADVMAFKPGAEVQAVLDSWAKSTATRELQNDELLLNLTAVKKLESFAYFPADVFTGNKEYQGPFVLFRDRWDKAMEWHAGRSTKAPPEPAAKKKPVGPPDAPIPAGPRPVA